jgi:hypothetical protein
MGKRLTPPYCRFGRGMKRTSRYKPCPERALRRIADHSRVGAGNERSGRFQAPPKRLDPHPITRPITFCKCGLYGDGQITGAGMAHQTQ